MVKGEAWIEKPEKSNLDRLIDEGISLTAPNKDKKYLLLAMLNLKCREKEWSTPQGPRKG